MSTEAERAQPDAEIEMARQRYREQFTQNQQYKDPSVEDPFFQWKSSPHAFKETLSQAHVTPLTRDAHEPVIGDPTRTSGTVGIPRVLEWITGGKLYKVNLLEGTAIESTFSREPHPVLKEESIVERPRVLGDDEFRDVVGQLRANEVIARTGVLNDIESRRKPQS